MWICPKCGRSFKKTGQDHYCGKAPLSIEEYILAQPEELRPRLVALDDAITKALPQAERKISWSMPAYWQGENLVQFALFKNHIGLYLGETAAAEFARRIKDFEVKKGTVRLPHNKPLPLEHISEIAHWRLVNR